MFHRISEAFQGSQGVSGVFKGISKVSQRISGAFQKVSSVYMRFSNGSYGFPMGFRGVVGFDGIPRTFEAV